MNKEEFTRDLFKRLMEDTHKTLKNQTDPIPTLVSHIDKRLLDIIIATSIDLTLIFVEKHINEIAQLTE